MVQVNLEKFFVETEALNELEFQETLEELVGNHPVIFKEPLSVSVKFPPLKRSPAEKLLHTESI